MKHIIDYLDQAKAITGSDNKTAKAMGIRQGHLSTFRGGQSISDDLCVKLAKVIDVDPMEVIAAKNGERTKSPEMRKEWENIWKSVAAAVLLAIGITSPTEDARAATIQADLEVDHVRYYTQWLEWLLELLGLPAAPRLA